MKWLCVKRECLLSLSTTTTYCSSGSTEPTTNPKQQVYMHSSSFTIKSLICHSHLRIKKTEDRETPFMLLFPFPENELFLFFFFENLFASTCLVSVETINRLAIILSSIFLHPGRIYILVHIKKACISLQILMIEYWVSRSKSIMNKHCLMKKELFHSHCTMAWSGQVKVQEWKVK